MGNRTFSLVLFFLVSLLLATPSQPLADMYKYTDGRGVVNITNNINSVPAKYRASMKVIKEEVKKTPAAAQEAQPEAAPIPSAPADAVAPAPEQPQGKFAQMCERFPWLKPIAYLAGILAALLVIMKVTSQLSSPLLAKVIYISFFLGVFVLLYKTYVGYMVESSARIKRQTETIMKNSVPREPQLPGDEAPPHGAEKKEPGSNVQ